MVRHATLDHPPGHTTSLPSHSEQTQRRHASPGRCPTCSGGLEALVLSVEPLVRLLFAVVRGQKKAEVRRKRLGEVAGLWRIISAPGNLGAAAFKRQSQP